MEIASKPDYDFLCELGRQWVMFSNCTIVALSIQQRQYFYLGMYTAMSIIQGGCGIPFLAHPVYEYILRGTCTNVQINVADIPVLSLRDTVQKVSK